jgi:hypothetical protein
MRRYLSETTYVPELLAELQASAEGFSVKIRELVFRFEHFIIRVDR